jgi:hypothetical protein
MSRAFRIISTVNIYTIPKPEKAIVPFMVNAFDYVTFIHMLT